MIIKECYVSHNGISCFTDINSLVNIKEIDFSKEIDFGKKIANNFWKKNLLFYISIRCIEEIAKDFINNKKYLFDSDNSDDIINSIMFT